MFDVRFMATRIQLQHKKKQFISGIPLTFHATILINLHVYRRHDEYIFESHSRKCSRVYDQNGLL